MNINNKYSPEKFEELVHEYIEHCQTDGIPITLLGFSLFAKIDRDAVRNNYKTKEPYKEAYKLLADHAENDLINNALLGKYSHAIAKLFLSHNYGIKETVEITATQNTFSINTSAAKLLPGMNDEE